MNSRQEQGGIATTAILSLLLISTLVFAIWAFGSMQDYKNNSDKKVAAAVTVAKQQQQQADSQKEAQDAEQPLKDFVGPNTFGSLHIKYPKTWSAYIALDNTGGSDPINAYFAPDYVPDVTTGTSLYALRVVITTDSYSQEMQQFTSNASSGTSTITAYSLPGVPSVVGSRIDGTILNNVQGSMVVLPLRNQAIEIWTESNQYLNDFNSNILPNVTFNP